MCWKNKFYLFYAGFTRKGYEQGPGRIGLAISDSLQEWKKRGVVLRPDSAFHWESAGLYQAFPMRYRNTFYLFYNARNAQSAWREQIGVATSQDLFHREKYPGNPVLRTGKAGSWDSRFVADPWVIRMHGDWHLYYYGFDGTHAREGVALGSTLFEWKKSSQNPILTEGAPGSYDATYAHKPCIIAKDGIYYHYYTAVGNQGRGIAVATSQPLTE